MRHILSIIIIFVLSFLEINWPESLKFAGTGPELLIIAVVFFALKGGAHLCVFPALLAGLIKGIFSPLPLGINLFFFIFLSLFISQERGRFNKESPFLVLTLTALAALLLNLAVYLSLRYLLFYPWSFFDSFVRIILPVTCYTAFLSPLLFAGLRRSPL